MKNAKNRWAKLPLFAACSTLLHERKEQWFLASG
jgi:hypothetical protein